MKPINAIRWTLEHASVEFDIDRKTISKRIRQEAIDAGKDLRYSTAQIIQAIFGDNEAVSRVKLNQARTELAQLQIESERGERIPLQLVIEVFDKTLAEVVQILKSVRGKEFDELTSADVLATFRQIPEKLKLSHISVTKPKQLMDDPMF